MIEILRSDRVNAAVAHPPSRLSSGLGERIIGRWGQLFLILCVVVPVTHNALKVAVLAPLALVATYRLCFLPHRGLSPSVQWFGLFYIGLGITFVTRGLFLSAPGWLYMIAVYVAGPIIMLILTSLVDTERRLGLVVDALLMGGIIGCAYIIYYFLWAAGFVPDSLFFRLDEDQYLTINGGVVQLHAFGISALLFLLPFALAYLATSSNERLSRMSFLSALLLVIGLPAAVLTGRKALWLALLTSPVLIAITSFDVLLRHQRIIRLIARRAFIALLIIATLSLPVASVRDRFDVKAIAGLFVSGFDFQNNEGANLRARQFAVLMDEWEEHPILGWGWGNGARGMTRSDRPWEYELQYVLLLFSTGLVGVVLYAVGVIWIVQSLWTLEREWETQRGLCAGSMVGLTGILLASATNPYLVSPGNMWMIFLPIAVINVAHAKDSTAEARHT